MFARRPPSPRASATRRTYALGPSRPSETPPRATRNKAEGAVVLLFFEKIKECTLALFVVVGVFLPTSAMGAAESRPPPPSWLVEACATLDPRDVDEVVSVFRRASSNAEAPGEPGASCPSNPADAAAWVVEQERNLGWRTLEHDASAREALREAFGTPPPLDAVLDRLARSVVAENLATTSGIRAGHSSSSAGDDRNTEKNQSGGALCLALASRALCRRAASGDGDAVARLTKAVSPKESEKNNLASAADRTRDERARIELARALASVAAPPRGTLGEEVEREAFLLEMAKKRKNEETENSADADGTGPPRPPRRTKKERTDAFETLLAHSAFDASMPSRRDGLVPDLTDEDGQTRLFRVLSRNDLEGDLSTDGDTGNDADGPSEDFLISPLSAWLLSRSMPAAWRVKWRRVFCSKTHGASFATLTSLCEDAGPTLVAIETDSKHVVGGVASTSLVSSAAFFGDARSFVFSLGRRRRKTSEAKGEAKGDGEEEEEETRTKSCYDFGASRATGANDHFCYCARGFVSGRFPNGLGFGGQVGHHCVFLDAGFETGHWRASAATFGGARLFPTETGADWGTFKVSAVEAWAVDGDFKARLMAERRAENRRGAGSGAGGGVRSARHHEARMLMETARRDAGGPERNER